MVPSSQNKLFDYLDKEFLADVAGATKVGFRVLQATHKLPKLSRRSLTGVEDADWATAPELGSE
jgi:transcriptional regulator with AAA-type ATPase domain